MDISSRSRTELLVHPGLDLQAARFSPSGDWIAFCARTESGGRIFVAKFDPARNHVEESWIAITGNPEKDLVPVWSQDGNLLYLLSDRDGYRCIWAQRLHPAAKIPLGPAFAVRHFHQPRHSLGSGASPGILLRHEPPDRTGLAVAADRLVFSVDDLIGDIWLVKWP